MCSARWRHDSRCRKRAHFPHAGGFLQHARARIERGTRRADVVDQHHNRSFQPAGASPTFERDRKSSTHVPVTLRGRQPGLRGGGSVAAKGVPDRHTEMARQVGGLIESALAPSREMKRDRNRPVGAHQHVRAADGGACTIARSAPSYPPTARARSTWRFPRRQRGHRASGMLIALQVGNGSPQRSQIGGVSGRIDRQQTSQTGPCVGCSRS